MFVAFFSLSIECVQVSMGVASVDDVLAWTVLAIATSVTVGGVPQDGAWGILIGIAWVTFLLVVVRRVLCKVQPLLGYNNYVVVVFLGMCISAWFTQVLGLHAFFGGFVFGLCVCVCVCPPLSSACFFSSLFFPPFYFEI